MPRLRGRFSAYSGRIPSIELVWAGSSTRTEDDPGKENDHRLFVEKSQT